MRLVLSLALLLSGASTVVAQPPTVVILARHGERAPEPRTDPVLSTEGEARARALASVLTDARVEAIVTSQFQRTRLTAAPLAQALNLTPEVATAGRDVAAHARAIADLIRQQHTGKTVLVVGHSNTLAPIIAALGGPRLPDLCDHEYSALLTVVLRPDGTASLVRGRFGAPDPPATQACERSLMMP